MNTYAYVEGNPLVNSDPMGLFAVPSARPATSTPALLPYMAPGVQPCLLCNSSSNYPPIGPEAIPAIPEFPYTIDPLQVNNGSNGLQTYDGTALECKVDNRDNCRKLLDKIYRAVYGRRYTARSGTRGLQERIYQQISDPGNLYKNNKPSWNRHNDEILAQQRRLKRLLDEARKLGCSVPSEIFWFLTAKPPVAPSR